MNFVYFPCNLLTKNGHESGLIAISRLRAGIDDKNYISKKIMQVPLFYVPTYCLLTLTIICQTNSIKLQAPCQCVELMPL